MSTRIFGLLTTTAAALALTASVGAASTAMAAPPPAPPASDAEPAPEAESAPDAEPAPDADAAPETGAAPQPPQDAEPAEPGKPAKPAKPATPAKPAKPAGKQVAKDGTDLKACMDAECEVKIKDGQEIKLDKKYGLKPIKVKVDGSQVTFIIQRGNSKMTTSTNAAQPNSTSSYNGLTLRPRMTKDGSIILTMSRQ